jgi:hypothetical protein
MQINLEKYYLRNQHMATEIILGQEYIINLKDFCQINKADPSKKRSIRRVIQDDVVTQSAPPDSLMTRLYHGALNLLNNIM